MNRLKIICICFFGMATVGCSSDWLEERSDKSLAVPSALKDFQAILDNSAAMNGAAVGGGGIYPNLGEVSSDSYYILENVWQNLPFIEERNAYVWNASIFEGNTSYDWNKMYITVFYANNVIEGITNLDINGVNMNEYNNVLGSALFYRSYAFFHLAQIFSRPYDANTANVELGIPLKLSSDFNEPIERATMSDTYDRILNDLEQAYDLLPETPLYKTRPSKPAVDAMLARAYLVMGEYGLALTHADRCLQSRNQLMDFNQLNVMAPLPFERFNEEVVFDASLTYSPALSSHIIDTTLFDSYEDNDLRKSAYFNVLMGNLMFKGSYSSSQTVFFCGLAVDEIYLIAAECNARLENLEAANQALQILMTSRYQSVNGVSTYPSTYHENREELLELILAERRKELVFRGLRWMDLRRLNKEGANIALTRSIGGNTYTLEPNSNRYTFPIPDDVILATGIEQNVR